MSYHRHVLSIGWAPERLANSDRSMLSWWDASKPLTIATGVSNMPDRGVNGLDFVQATAAAQPAFTGAGSTSLITYDGVEEFLEQPVTTGDFQNLTRFSWFAAGFFDSTATRRPWDFGDDGGAGTNRWGILLTSSNEVSIAVVDNSTVHSSTTDTSISDGWHIVGVVATGSTFEIYVDNVLRSTTDVSNNGMFLGDMTNKTLIDILAVGSFRWSPTGFEPNLEKFQLCFGGTVNAALSTAAERTEIFNYINNKFQLGL